MKSLRFALLTMCAIALTASAVAQKQDKKGKEVKAAKKEVVVPAAPADSAGPISPSDYIIGPEDVLAINVWKEAELSGSVPVRPDGKISMALLNDVQAAGLTPMELTNQITEKLKKFLEDPHVNVTVSAINSRRVYIVGQVLHAGAFPLTPQMTVLQALSTAGGLTEFANGSKAYILRAENGSQTKMPFDYKAVLAGQKAEQNIVLKPGDTVVVP